MCYLKKQNRSTFELDKRCCFLLNTRWCNSSESHKRTPLISTFNPYLQIFPEPSEQMKGAARLKERLPSIVVEPSEESGEQNSVVDEEEEEEEDPFQDRCDPAGSGQEEQADVDRSVPALHRIP